MCVCVCVFIPNNTQIKQMKSNIKTKIFNEIPLFSYMINQINNIFGVKYK